MMCCRYEALIGEPVPLRAPLFPRLVSGVPTVHAALAPDALIAAVRRWAADLGFGDSFLQLITCRGFRM